MIRHRYNIFIKSNHNSNVEGVTEFITVSSTGNMILIGWAIGFEGEFAKMFEVVIQLS